MHTRRKFIAAVMAVVMLKFGLTTKGQSQDGHPTKRALEGSWRVTVTPGRTAHPVSPKPLKRSPPMTRAAATLSQTTMSLRADMVRGSLPDRGDSMPPI